MTDRHHIVLVDISICSPTSAHGHWTCCQWILPFFKRKHAFDYHVHLTVDKSYDYGARSGPEYVSEEFMNFVDTFPHIQKF